MTGGGDAGLMSLGKRASSSGESCSIIILLFFAPFDVDLDVAVADDIEVDVGVDGGDDG